MKEKNKQSGKVIKIIIFGVYLHAACSCSISLRLISEAVILIKSHA